MLNMFSNAVQMEFNIPGTNATVIRLYTVFTDGKGGILNIKSSITLVYL